MKRKLIVTGGAGFIGSNFVNYWCLKYPNDQIVVLDDLTYAGNKKNILPLIESKKIIFKKINICNANDISEVVNNYGLTHLVNFAAESHVDKSIQNPRNFINTNILGTYNLIEIFRSYYEKSNSPENLKFLQVSTDEVYGSLEKEDNKFNELSPYKPQSPYSASKASADHIVKAWGNTYDLPILISNCSNNYGPYHYPEKLIPLTIVNILKGKEIPIYGDGSNIRDWLYVTDHCAALDLILLNSKNRQSYCIGGNCELTNLNLVMKICDYMDEMTKRKGINLKIKPSSSLINYVEDRKGHDFRYSISYQKIENSFGWRPSISIREGLKLTINWFLENREWWDN